MPLKRFVAHARDAVLRSGTTRQGSVWVRLHGSLTRPRITMAARKRKPKSLRSTDRPMPMVSTAVAGFINMAVTAVASGTVLLCLFAAKRML